MTPSHDSGIAHGDRVDRRRARACRCTTSSSSPDRSREAGDPGERPAVRRNLDQDRRQPLPRSGDPHHRRRQAAAVPRTSTAPTESWARRRPAPTPGRSRSPPPTTIGGTDTLDRRLHLRRAAADPPDGDPTNCDGTTVKLLTKLTLLALAVSALPVAIAGYFVAAHRTARAARRAGTERAEGREAGRRLRVQPHREHPVDVARRRPHPRPHALRRRTSRRRRRRSTRCCGSSITRTTTSARSRCSTSTAR